MKLQLRPILAGALFLLASAEASSQCVTLTCQSNVTVSNDSNNCSAVVNYLAPTAVNSCTTSASITFNYIAPSLQTYTVPAGVTMIHIDASGAQGGSVSTSCTGTGGLGAQMVGDFAVTPGEVLSIMVGQQGLTNGSDAGGGGGTFVVRTGNVLLVAAGGGGGATNNITQCGSNLNGLNATITTSGTASGNGVVAGGINGNGGGASNGSGGGGGGFLTDGIAGTGIGGNNGKCYLNGGAGGTGNNNDFGGYGGGGAGWFTGGNGGGGGGYSGGATSGSQPFTGGGGGGSYSIGTNQVNAAGFQSGNGRVIISYSVTPPVYVSLLSGMPSGSAFPVGVNNVTYIATDSTGGNDTCTFTITVTDNDAPVLTCGGNVLSCDSIVNGIAPNATETCSLPMTVTFVLSGATSGSGTGDASGTAFAVGTTTVTYTATDSAGNSSNCSFDVIVSTPSIGVSSSSSLLCLADAPASLTGTPAGGMWMGPGVTGNSFDPGAAGLGTHMVAYSYTDSSGCTGSDSLAITVDVCTGIAANGLDAMQVAPNPTSGTMLISLGVQYANVELTLVELNGQVVRTEKYTNTSSMNFSLENVATGVYFLTIRADEEVKTVKVIRN